MMGYDKSIICIFKMSFLNYVADLEEWYFFSCQYATAQIKRTQN